MKEVWKDIPNYEGLYQVSNLGNIKSNQKKIYKSNGKAFMNVLRKERILKKSIRQGYYAVKLYKDNNKKTIPVHRIVAKTFLKNNENKPCVNHIDGNKLNNNVSNLEWCTYSENTLHAYKNGLQKITEKQRENCREMSRLGNEKNKKKVNQYEKNGTFIKQWECISDVYRDLNIKTTSISACCKRKRKTAGGFIWKYANEL